MLHRVGGNTKMVYVTVTQRVEETKVLGERLAKWLRGGEVICLSGELGSGKTCFVQGLARGLGVLGEVISPTFILVREYQGRLPLFHVDAYRLADLGLKSIEEVKEVGLQEYLERGGVVVIEWADQMASLLPPERLDIVFIHLPKGRQIEMRPHGQRYESLITWLEKE